MTSDGLGAAFPDVLAAAQAGAGWALERLWVTYSAKVAGYLRVQGAAEPDDLTSEVFIGAFRTIGTFNGNEAQFRSWLFTIAHRRLQDSRRSATRRPASAELALNNTPATPGAEAAVLQTLATEGVRLLCERLVPDQRDVLLLRLVSGMTVEEVAEATGKSAGAVKQLQRRGLNALRKVLVGEGVPL